MLLANTSCGSSVFSDLCEGGILLPSIGGYFPFSGSIFPTDLLCGKVDEYILFKEIYEMFTLTVCELDLIKPKQISLRQGFPYPKDLKYHCNFQLILKKS